LELVILPEVIQRTAIWILATFALWTPAGVVFEQIRETNGAGRAVWSVQIRSHEPERSASRKILRGWADSVERISVSPDPNNAITVRLYFGSLYNRPPPAVLSFS